MANDFQVPQSLGEMVDEEPRKNPVGSYGEVSFKNFCGFGEM